MALIAQALVTADEVDAYIQNQSATNDTVIEYLINSVSQEFSTYSDRAFINTLYTAFKMDGNGYHTIYLPNYPVTGIYTMSLDGVVLTVDVDFYLDVTFGSLIKIGATQLESLGETSGIWPEGHQNISVTYTAGYLQTALPADLKLAALKEIARQFQIFIGKQHGESSRSVQGSSVSISEPEHPEWMEVVRRYRRLRV